MELLDTDAASRYLSVSPATLAYWRSRGAGPAWFKLGRRVMYRPAALDQFVESQEQATQLARAAQ